MTAITNAPKTKDETLRDSVQRHLKYTLGVAESAATQNDVYRALSLAVRDQVIDSMNTTEERYSDAEAKRVYYLSMEFLIGQSLENNLRNLRVLEAAREVMQEMGYDINDLVDREPDAGLGNGGLGRLAACFLDSLATLEMPGYGYGINYEFGLFRQEIVDGNQREQPDAWQADGSPWLIERPNDTVIIPVYGRVEDTVDRDGNYNPMWTGWEAIVGVPSDLPIVGYPGNTTNYLRLFSARGSREFDMGVFNTGDYLRAVQQKVRAENISKVLYPSDAVREGRELRLIQEYFLVACAIRDVVRRHEASGYSINELAEKAVFQLNDTHPALAVAELMRLLVDERSLDWDHAWQITHDALAYTNHTLLPEALERWPVELFERVLPRHLQLIYEINSRFVNMISSRWPGDTDRIQRMSIIQEHPEREVRMCNLAVVGSHSVNGVSAMHSELVKHELLKDFNEIWPERFNNKTNGITPRRWLHQCNPRLSQLITKNIGSDWVTDLDQLRHVEAFAGDAAFRDEFRSIKRECKVDLGKLIKSTTGIVVDPDSMFDVQIKRIHEYKRQLLNVLRIVHEFFAIVEDGKVPACPRTYIFAGKAAPGYWAAKQIIKLINNVAQVVNNHPVAKEWMRVVFIPNYRVSVAEKIFPASELSEQISTAGYEASGTGNMKFALNGALTMGTMDGANIEIHDEVGEDNIFIFGLTAQAVTTLKQNGYRPQHWYAGSQDLQRVIATLSTSYFSSEEPELFRWIGEQLLSDDNYMLLADFDTYLGAQERASQVYADPHQWTEKAILNTARVGTFSSDRTIREYASDIWGVQSIPHQS